MTIVITGPGRRAPRHGVMFLLIIAVLVVAIGLILLGLIGNFLIDWLWFSATGYFARLPGDHRSQSANLFRRLRGDRYHSVG